MESAHSESSYEGNLRITGDVLEPDREAEWLKNTNRGQRCMSEVPVQDNKRLPCVEEGFQADIDVMALLTPFEELLDPGIDGAIKILLLTGIPRFNSRNFIFSIH